MTDVRALLAKTMKATLAAEAAHHNWTYAEVRPLPMPPRKLSPAAAVLADCSKGVQYICWWTPGAPDPMGNGWSEYGNSQTIWSALHHLDTVEQLEIGDVVTFGVDGDAHAAMVLEAGPDPLLWSHGHQGAPDTYRLTADTRPHQFLKLPLADPPPTAAELLHAKTGFYSWVAWKLGEGPWAPYGSSNPAVRPLVNRTISQDWWRRFNAFVDARKNGNPSTTAG